LAEEIVAFCNSVNVLKNYPCMGRKKRKGVGEQKGNEQEKNKNKGKNHSKINTAPLPPLSVTLISVHQKSVNGNPL
jgi:hypothetical protein